MDRFPQYLCIFCVRTLQKFAQFRAQCHKILEVLYQTLVQGHEVTVELARNITLNYKELKPQYTRTKTLLLDVFDPRNSGVKTSNQVKSPRLGKRTPGSEALLQRMQPGTRSKEEKVLTPSNVNNIANPLDLSNLCTDIKDDKEEHQSANDIIYVIMVDELPEPKQECSKDVVYVEKADDIEYLEVDDHFDSFTDDFEEAENEEPIIKKKKIVKVSKKKKLEYNVTEPIERKTAASKFNKRVMIQFAESMGFDLTELSLAEQIQEIAEKKQDLSSDGFICDQCGKRFNNFGCLKRHKYCHILKPNCYVCDLCSWVFKKKNSLIEHMLDHRYLFRCKYCNFKTKKNSSLKHHHEFHLGKMFKCKYCDKAFHKLTTSCNHMRFKHEPELPWCDLCGEAFIGEKGVISHKKLMHNNTLQLPFECVECKKKFRSEAALDRHAIVKGCESPSCVHCGEAFPSDQLLKHHLIQRHIDCAVPNTFDCKLCPFRFYTHEALEKHECGCAAACAQCGDSFDSQQMLIDHVTMKHDIFKCEKCDRQFSLQSFKAHYMLRHSEERFEYSKRSEYAKKILGDRVFKPRSDWIRGRIKDDRIRKWRVGDGGSIKKVDEEVPRNPDSDENKTQMCEACGSCFRTAKKLSLHKWRVHRPVESCYRCPHCPKTFNAKISLDIHIRVHTGERPHRCPQCPKAFKSRNAYTRHFLIHTRERKHMCTICNRMFVTSTCVKMHIKTAHMKMPWPARNRRPKRNE